MISVIQSPQIVTGCKELDQMSQQKKGVQGY